MLYYFSISSWADVDAIGSYPAISILRLAHIPLFAGRGASEVRPIVIARIPSLHLFNGSGVTSKERITAEKVYLRQALNEKKSDEKLNEVSSVFTSMELLAAFTLKHPRFAELSSKYEGDVIGTTDSEIGASMGADLISIQLNNVSYSSVTGQQCDPIVKKLPSTLTVGRLKSIVKQIFGLDPAAQQLSIRDSRDVPPTLLDDDEATLRYFGACNGCEIFINETDEA